MPSISSPQRAVALTIMGVPLMTRLLLTRRATRDDAQPWPWWAPVGDLILREIGALTFAVITLSALTPWTPGWKWGCARQVMLVISAASFLVAISATSIITTAFDAMVITYVTTLSMLSAWLWLPRDRPTT